MIFAIEFSKFVYPMKKNCLFLVTSDYATINEFAFIDTFLSATACTKRHNMHQAYLGLG